MLRGLAWGGAAAAIAASTCCVLPLLLGSLGLGGALIAGFGVLAPYQTAFRVAAVLLLGAGFWMTYARTVVVADGAACTRRATSGWTKPVLWTAAFILGVVLSEPLWLRWLA